MKVIARQFTKDILLSTLFVLIVLIALFAFFGLIGQMDEVGRNEYDLATAFLLTGLTLPQRAYELSPLAVLLAAVYTMSRWASTSEFTVLRAAGMSPGRLAAMLVVPGLVLLVSTYVLGEVAAPWSMRYSTEVRSANDPTLTARGYNSGAWVRDLTKTPDGTEVDRFINISSISAANRLETGAWRVFEFNDAGKLSRIVRAESGVFTPGKGWTLRNAVETIYPKFDRDKENPQQAPLVRRTAAELPLASTVTPEILGVMMTKPERMAMLDLSSYIAHLDRVNQVSDHYRSVFWSKAFYPVGVLVMLAISMPFGYLNARSGGVAIKIFLGVLIGIAFYALNNLFSYLSAAASAPPALMAAVPSVFMLGASALALWWVERR